MMRDKDWSASTIGPIATWPQSLRSMLSAVFNSLMLGAVLWGPELLFFYNDAYIPSLGQRHPDGLGRPVSEVCSGQVISDTTISSFSAIVRS